MAINDVNKRTPGLPAAFFKSSLGQILAIAAAFLLASCQSATLDNSFNIGGAGNSGSGAETIGSGPVRVAMIVHRTSGGAETALGRDYRNGADMAVKDLGPQAITMSILDSRGNPERVKSLLRDELSKKAQLIIIPGDLAAVSSVSSLVSDSSPPIVSLGTISGKGIYSFLPQAADGLAEGIGYAAGKKGKRVLLVAPSGVSGSLSTQIKQRLPGSRFNVSVAASNNSASGQEFVTNYRDQLRKTDVIAFAGSDIRIAGIAAALKNDRRFAKLPVVGREDWPSGLLSSPALQGAIVATRDTSGTSLIQDRYRSAYSRPLTESAAYSYDVVALAAGLVRALGAQGLSKSQLLSSTGFRGTTGLFRFGQNGNVQRLYRIAKVRNGRLETVRKSPEAF